MVPIPCTGRCFDQFELPPVEAICVGKTRLGSVLPLFNLYISPDPHISPDVLAFAAVEQRLKFSAILPGLLNR